MVWGCGTKICWLGSTIESGTFEKRLALLFCTFCLLLFSVSLSLSFTLLYGTYYVYFYSLSVS